MKDEVFSKDEAQMLSEYYHNPDVETVEQFKDNLRQGWKEAEDKVAYVTGWRRMFLQDLGIAAEINERIRAAIAERKAA